MYLFENSELRPGQRWPRALVVSGPAGHHPRWSPRPMQQAIMIAILTLLVVAVLVALGVV